MALAGSQHGGKPHFPVPGPDRPSSPGPGLFSNRCGPPRTALRGGRPVDPNTVFRLASLSKTFAGGIVARLVADGALAWDDPALVFPMPELY